MQKSIFRKGLVAGVIVLFLGIGIQPAFAIEISNVRQSESIEDCNCEVDDNVNLVRLERLSNRINSFIDRVETCNKLMPILYKANPEIITIGEELSEKITTYREIIDEEFSDQISLYSSQSNDLLCDILETLFQFSYNSMINLAMITENFKERSIMYLLLGSVVATFAILAMFLLLLYATFDCSELPPIL